MSDDVATKEGVVSNDDEGAVDGVVDDDRVTHELTDDEAELEDERDSIADTDGDCADDSLDCELKLGSWDGGIVGPLEADELRVVEVVGLALEENDGLGVERIDADEEPLEETDGRTL